MASTCSVLKKSVFAIFIFSSIFLCASSFYAGAPDSQPPSYASAAYHPTLCNFDELYKVGTKYLDNIESCNVGVLHTCGVHEIYQLGDSISDVGNLIREVPVGAAAPFGRLPYGSNFPTGPTGRASNGKLMIDYFAMDAGLPLLPPFKQSDADFSHGVNFAVAGATALVPSNVYTPMTNSSLSVQLDWMSGYFNSICHNRRDCGGKFENALFVLGPFGGSDYHNALFEGKSVDEIQNELLPKVVDAIMAGVRRLISLGAKKVMVPGLYTVFDLPFYQAALPEKTWKRNIDIAIYHNDELAYAIEKFNKEEKHDDVVIFFGDYLRAFLNLQAYALLEKEMDYYDMKACCGTGGGNYNLDLRRMCGAEGVSSCKEPQKKIFWDGLNLTQEAYRIMTKYILYGIFRDLHCSSS